MVFSRSGDTGHSDSAIVCTITPLHTNFVCTNLHITTAAIQTQQKFSAQTRYDPDVETIWSCVVFSLL